jgi:hypothetical protein
MSQLIATLRLVIAFGLCGACCAAVHEISATDDDAPSRVQEREEIRKSFFFPAGTAKTIDLDNVDGSVEVVGSASNDVELVVQKTLRADSQEQLAVARREVSLNITPPGDALRLYVDGPFRCENHDCEEARDDRGYEVQMDFHLIVPRDATVHLRTVNRGRIRVEQLVGDFDLHNVNGGIEMKDISGSGRARTVNGGISAVFQDPPRASCEFSSVNGEVELQLSKNASADFRFKTMNGSVYTDFPMTALPGRAPITEHRGNRVVIRTDGTIGGRIGAGGPEISVDTLNGDIRIQEHKG